MTEPTETPPPALSADIARVRSLNALGGTYPALDRVLAAAERTITPPLASVPTDEGDAQAAVSADQSRHDRILDIIAGLEGNIYRDTGAHYLRDGRDGSLTILGSELASAIEAVTRS